MLSVVTQVWAKPSKEQQFQEEVAGWRGILQANEIADIQDIYDRHRSQFKVDFDKNKTEYDVSYTGSNGTIKSLEFPLEFYLNEGGARFDNQDNRIVVNPSMTSVTYNAGKVYIGRAVQNETARVRDKQATDGEAQAKAMDLRDKLGMAGVLFFAVAICGVVVGTRRGIRSARKINSGKSFEEYKKETWTGVEDRLKKAQVLMAADAQKAVNEAVASAATDRTQLFNLTETVQGLKKAVDHLTDCATGATAHRTMLGERIEQVEEALESQTQSDSKPSGYSSKEPYLTTPDIPEYKTADDLLIPEIPKTPLTHLPNPDVSRNGTTKQTVKETATDELEVPFSQLMEKAAT